ncbi:hypothetical protein [Acaryochloris sp. CCMEE 5410]|uniref:hypothetical protein n=1 Tax=Acaryochloris sp. CCMEE 5410 TaxID=310037 RepID=UPI0021D102E0|nr:hypothetical protein [Acaryochloris sp. CCMEE 5410]
MNNASFSFDPVKPSSANYGFSQAIGKGRLDLGLNHQRWLERTQQRQRELQAVMEREAIPESC